MTSSSWWGISIVLVVAGCASTTRAPHVKKSGFLKDESLLKPWDGDEGLLAYVNPGVKTSDYDKMILTPPVLARKPGRADAEAICDYWADRISEFLATEHSKTKK